MPPSLGELIPSKISTKGAPGISVLKACWLSDAYGKLISNKEKSETP